MGGADDAADAARQIDAEEPDVAIVDVSMSEDGIDLCRHLISRHPHVKCLVLAGFDDEQALIDVLLTGAIGLLREQAGAVEVAATVRVAASGHWVLEPLLESHTDHDAAEDQLGLLEQLTERERQMAERITEGLTNREIAEQLHLSEKTVRNYISALLAKLGMRNRTQVATMLTQLVVHQRALPERRAIRGPRPG